MAPWGSAKPNGVSDFPGGYVSSVLLGANQTPPDLGSPAFSPGALGRIVVHGQVLQRLHRVVVGVGPNASARLVRMEPDQPLSPNTLTGMASTPHSRRSVSAGMSTGKK